MRRSLQQPSKWGAIAAALGVLLSFSPGARAEEREEAKRYRLRWLREGGAESCVSGAALERLLEQVLGVRGERSSSPVLLQGVAQVAAPPLRFAMRVTVRDEKTDDVLGERELTTVEAKCSTLTPALLLVLAMSVDPDAGRDGLPPAVTEELRRGREEDVDVWPAASPASPASSASLTVATNGTRWREGPPSGRANAPNAGHADSAHDPVPDGARWGSEPRVFGALTMSAGVFPALASGAELGGRVPLRRGWSLAFSVLGWLPQVVALPASPYLQDEGVQVAAGQLSAALCQPLFGARFQLGVCGGVFGGLRWMSALALGSRDNPTRPFYGPILGIDGTFRVAASWFAAGGITAQASVPRDRFTYREHLGQVRTWFEPALFSGRAWLGVGAFL